MAEERDGLSRHFILEGITETEAYRYPGSGGGSRPGTPARDRVRHGQALQRQIDQLRPVAEAARDAQQAVGMDQGVGLQVEFESFPDIELVFESLARERSGIELLNVRHEGDRTSATVFVPDGKLGHFERLLRDYLTEKRDRAGRPRDHQRLINAIQEIRAASLRALWTDGPEVFPTADEGPVWWEVWLPVRHHRQVTVAAFRERATAQGIDVAQGELVFPERTVLVARASLEQMQRSMVTLNSIAELRRPKETAEFFDSLTPDEQGERVNDLLSRTTFPQDTDDTPFACLLDTGINRGHPLLTRALSTNDLHTVEPGWGTNDVVGHGTEMAGIALVGNLADILAGNSPVEIDHRLESVKLIPWDGGTGSNSQHHGHLTVEAVARPEARAPSRRRVFGMAVTARDNRDRGRPTAWSAAVDGLATDVLGDGANPRLMIVSAGNINEPGVWPNYPDSNETDGIHDPAQAWNALTVGAFTQLVRITEPGAYSPIAPAGGLSPFSTTSLTWERHWPLKPDVVFEGGNAAEDSFSAVWLPSLSLLTTNFQPANRLVTTTNATSAATALASRFAARVMAVYPHLWPETVRALIVHSAEWTATMRRQFLAPQTPTKADYLRLVRRCGFGVPDIDHALWTVDNSLTMVVEETLYPYQRTGSRAPTLRDMHLHRLPWPRDALEDLGEAPVEMRVTLSYFIEPNPSRRGHRSRYRYESHGLRFDVKRSLESVDQFRKRVNLAARDEDEGTRRGSDGDPEWLIGPQGRHVGSLHCDIWRGTAADLASRGSIAVYPTAGWWKTRQALGRYGRAARYALVVSIRAPEVDVDLYTEVANRIAIDVGI